MPDDGIGRRAGTRLKSSGKFAQNNNNKKQMNGMAKKRILMHVEMYMFADIYMLLVLSFALI